jgi:hypothetical protein
MNHVFFVLSYNNGTLYCAYIVFVLNRVRYSIMHNSHQMDIRIALLYFQGFHAVRGYGPT